jgi:hypothetical protein
MRAPNLGMEKAMALDTLGNAYLYLREVYSTTPWNTAEGKALLASADILQDAFSALQSDFTMYNFVEKVW